MRFLADENFPGVAVVAIRGLGHDNRWVREDSPGVSDTAVLHQAHSENRIVLTFDKDFGELVFRIGENIPPGVLLFRITPLSPTYLLETIPAVIETRDDWVGHFSVIEPDKIRMTPLPFH